MRGSALRKCSLVETRPRPGRFCGTSAAILRSISESRGSPSRSSSRVPNRSRIAARKSAHRLVAATMCTPKVRPRVDSCWISISRSSKSARSVLQPSMTRNTSPYPSSARPCAPPRPVGLDRVDAVGPEVLLAPVHDAGHLGDDPAHHVGLGAGADPGHVRQTGHPGEGAAAEVEHEELRLLRRGRQRQAGHDRPQQRALAAARTADHGEVPGAAGQVDERVSRRCSRGRSTVPSGTTRPPSARHSCETRPSCGSAARSGISWSRVSGTSSGGSQTWCAAGPWPSRWSDRDLEQRLLLAAVDRCRARAPARRPGRRASAPPRS